MGQLAAKKLISLIERKDQDPEYETVMLETYIKARASTQSKH
jgi:LacI family transcriptional regulator